MIRRWHSHGEAAHDHRGYKRESLILTPGKD
jgi:hypothetical protein